MSGKTSKKRNTATKGKEEEELLVEHLPPEPSVASELSLQQPETSSTVVSRLLPDSATAKGSVPKAQEDHHETVTSKPKHRHKKKKHLSRKQAKAQRKRRRSLRRQSKSYSISFYDLDSEEDDSVSDSFSSSEETASSEEYDSTNEDSDSESDTPETVYSFNSVSTRLAKIKVKIKLPVLKSTRVTAFKAWQDDFQNVLAVRDLEDLLSIPNLKEALRMKKDPSFDFVLWSKLSRKLYALIRSCLPDQYKRIIQTFAQNDGTKAFQVLDEHVRSKSQYRQNYLLERLANIKMRPEQDPSEFITYLVDLMDELQTTGERFNEKHRISKVLSKLPPDYDGIVNTFNILPSRKKTLLRLTNMLDADFKKQTYRDPSKNRKKNNNNNNKIRLDEKKSPHQNKSSHSSEKKSGPFQKSSTTDWIKRARCFKCNKHGHLAKDCPNSDEEKAKQHQKQVNTTKKTQEKAKEKQKIEKEKTKSKFHLNIAQKTNKREDWCLQQEVYDQLKTIFQVEPTLDPFATPVSTKCANYFTIEDNAFTKDWHKHKIIYLNPSYQDYGRVLRKFKTEGNTALVVFPHWPSAKWFDEMKSLLISPLIVLPDLKENVFINTQREIKHQKRPNWSAMAAVIQSPRVAPRVEMQQHRPFVKPTPNDLWSVEKDVHLSETLTLEVYTLHQKKCKAFSLNTAPKVNWLIDSGCNHHATGTKELFYNLKPYGKNNEVIEIADGVGLKIEGIGNVRGKTPCGVELVVNNVLYVPNLAKNILSFNQLETDQKVKIKLRKRQLLVHQTNIKLVEDNKLVYLQLIHKERKHVPIAYAGEQQWDKSVLTLHAALGHPGKDKTTLLSKYYDIQAKDHSCDTCKIVKNTRSPFHAKSNSPKATQPYEKVAGDLTSISTVSCEGHKYISGFKDEASSFIDVTPIKSKTETLSTFKKFLQNYDTPEQLLTDNGTEYTNQEFNSLCKKEKIKREYTCPYSSQQNGSMERAWRTLMQITRANLKYAGLPKPLWNYAAIYSSIQMNCWPKKYKHQDGQTFVSTPWEQLYGTKPNPKRLKVFGCDSYFFKFKHQRNDKKLSKRGKKGVFLGLPPNTKGYLILDPSNNEIFITRDVTFEESNFTAAKEVSFEHVEDERDSDYSDEEELYYSEEEDGYLSSATSEESLSDYDYNEEESNFLSEQEDELSDFFNKSVEENTKQHAEGQEIEDDVYPFEEEALQKSSSNITKSHPMFDQDENASEGGEVLSKASHSPSSASKLQNLLPTFKKRMPKSKEEFNKVQEMGQPRQKQDSVEDLEEDDPTDSDFEDEEQQDAHKEEIYPPKTEFITPEDQTFLTKPTEVNQEQRRQQQTQPRRSQRLKTAKPPSDFWRITSTVANKTFTGESALNLLEKHDQKLLFTSEKVTFPQRKEPNTYKQAMKSEEREEWKTAIENELQSLQHLKTWEVVDTPNNKNIIQPKWVFKRKTRDGILDKYKARLVAKGFTQTEGVDYFDTFSPVARHSTTRLFIANATQRKRKLLKVDIKNAYLNAPVKEEIYLHIPEGLRIEEAARKCLKLQKSLYGLKQSARNWYEFLVDWLTSQQFKMSKTDPCLFYREEDNSYVLIYVDDILVDINSESEQQFKRELECAFTLSEYEELKWHLGLTVNQGELEVNIHQKSYIEELAKKFHLQESKPVCTPTTNQRLPYPQQQEEATLAPYRSIVGGLLWLSTMSRPDLTFPVHDLSRHLNHPTNEHWNAAKRVLKYAFHTRDFCLHYIYQDKVSIVGYSDADWIGDPKDSKSCSGYIFLFNEAPICWSTTKQTKVALSTCEAEYMALAEATKEALYLHKLLDEMKIQVKLPIPIYVDNKACITISENPAFHKRTKHIAANFHFVRDVVREEKLIKLIYVPSELNLADVFTKPLIGRKFYRHRDLMMNRISFEEEC